MADVYVGATVPGDHGVEAPHALSPIARPIRGTCVGLYVLNWRREAVEDLK